MATRARGDSGPVQRYPVLRPQQLRDVNEIAVLRHLIANGSASRLEIANALGLTQGPITRIVGRLMERGLARESPAREASAGRGRPRIPVEVNADAYVIVGAHIGLQHLTIGTAGIDGKPSKSIRLLHGGTWEGTLALIAEFVSNLHARPNAPILAVGVIIGGLIEPDRGVLLRHEALGWHNIPMRDDLATALGCPTFVESSVRAHANADLLFGTASDVRDFLHVFVGNIVEIAAVIDGRVRAGRDGLGGDVSSWFFSDADGRAITVADALGDQNVLENARRQGVIGRQDDLDALVAVANGPSGSTARDILLARASSTGVLLAQIDALLAPSAIVISSGVLAVEGALEAATTTLRKMRQCSSVPSVRVSRYGTNPLVSAAAALVLERTVLNAEAATSITGSVQASATRTPTARPLKTDFQEGGPTASTKGG